MATQSRPEDSIEVRRLAPSEWQLLRDLRPEALREAPEAFESTAAAEELFVQAEWLLRIDRRAVAFDADRPVGVVGWAPAPNADHTTELISMWVAPEARGTAIAGELIDVVRDVARRQGDGLRLAVHADNARARRCYERCGFVSIAEQVSPRSGRRLIWMRDGVG